MSTSAALISGAAGRYTSAIFELAESTGALDTVEREFRDLRNLIQDSPDLAHVIASPAFSREEQGSVINAVVSKLGQSDLTRKFVGLMASKGRLALLPDAMKGFEALLAAHRGNVTAEVTTAQALSDAQRAALTDNLNKSLGKSVQIEESVDPSLLGGMIVKVGSKMVDASLKSKLERLELAMQEH